MEEKEYLETRLDDQLAWYSDKSTYNKKRFHWLKAGEIVLSVSIPFAVGFVDTGPAWMQVAIGVAGVCIALAAGISSLYKYQENWVEYRTTAEGLKRERYFYLSRTGPYRQGTSEEAFHLLVERVEQMLSSENLAWKSVASQTKEIKS